MERSATDLQARVRALAPLTFQVLALALARRVYGDALEEVRDNHGEGNGCDGVLAGSSGLHAFQVKTIESALGDPQRAGVRHSIDLACQRLPTERNAPLRRMTLLFNINLQPNEAKWLTGYVERVRTDRDIEVDYHGLSWVVDQLLREENASLRQAFIETEMDRQDELLGLLRGGADTPNGAALRSGYLEALLALHAEARSLGMVALAGDLPLLNDVYVEPMLSVDEPAPTRSERVQSEGDDDDETFDRVAQTSAPGQRSLSDWIALELAGGGRPILCVAGPIGTGKSTLLAETVASLARRCLTDVDAPIPLLVRAADLAHGGLHHAAASLCFLHGDLFNAKYDWLVFVDGLDEVAESERALLARSLSVLRLDPHVRLLIVAGRPPSEDVPPDARHFRLGSWSPEDSQRYLEKWRERFPEAVRAVSESPHRTAVEGLMSVPLTATFCLFIAKDQPEALKDRTQLFGAVSTLLFQEWARSRGLSIKWREVAENLQRLALALLGGHEAPGWMELQGILSKVAPDRQGELRDAASLFGLLTRTTDGRYSFTVRGLAERLAGEQASRLPPEQLADLAALRWGSEVVRHAIGCVNERDGSGRALNLISGLLEKGADMLPGSARRVFATARAAADLGESARPIAAEIANGVGSYLLNETSPWRNRRARDVVLEVAGIGGPCWDAIRDRLARFVVEPGLDPGQWLERYGAGDLDYWVLRLFYRNPAVRRVAVRRLAKWVNDAEIRQGLVAQLFDADFEVAFQGSVAIEAGITLRSATRDASFGSTRDDLVAILDREEQLPSGSAACALLPGEASTETVIKALQHLAQGYRIPRVVLTELAGFDSAVLDSLWPDWRTTDRAIDWPRLQPPEHPVGDVQPAAPSGHIFAEIVRAITPGLALLEPRARGSLLERARLGHPECVEAICTAGSQDSGLLLDLLTIPTGYPQLMIGHGADAALARAAQAHPAILDRILSLCREQQANPDAMGHFLGALPILAATGNEEAARIYAVWIEIAKAVEMVPPSRLLPEALILEPVRPVAIARARALAGGSRGQVWAGALGAPLLALRAAWYGDPEVTARLIAIADSGNDERLKSVLLAFDGMRAPDALGTIVGERIAEVRAEGDVRETLDLHYQLRWADRAGLGRQISEGLHWLMSFPRFSNLARAILVGVVSRDEARSLSAEVAASWQRSPLLRGDKALLGRLVAANPEAWLEETTRLLKGGCDPGYFMALKVPDITRALAPHLAGNEADAFVKLTADALRCCYWPWCRDIDAMEVFMPGDVAHQLLFDLGR